MSICGLQPDLSAIITPQAMTGIRMQNHNWHRLLRHPSTKVFSHLCSSKLLLLSSNITSSMHFHSCSCNKNHKLSFGVYSFQLQTPKLDLYSFQQENMNKGSSKWGLYIIDEQKILVDKQNWIQRKSINGEARVF